ncbi:MAG: type II 3-dehydroquinate dehydratase [Deltaproteobacteria bacterium]|nr:type II 3-dehydroquinate dehydratase [Deltaproteobacteria bacterium]NIS76624.1 type II 3-dehydroquinate dehydratase [Deltaproteobacteria bacterium]
MKILFISGPNINLTGTREVEVYGETSYENMMQKVTGLLTKQGVEIEFFQSNHEGDIVDKIQSAQDIADGIVINPGAYTHTSVAIRDALIATGVLAVEVHISNVYAREEFRKASMIEDVVRGKICGFGWYSYYLGALALMNAIKGT